MKKVFLLLLAALGFSAYSMAQNVAKINDVEYATLDEALAVAAANDTITLLADVTCETLPAYAGEGIVNLDINGYTFKTPAVLELPDSKIKFTGGFGVVKGQGDSSMGNYPNLAVLPTFDAAVAYRNATDELKASDYRIIVYESTLEAPFTVPHKAENNQRVGLNVRKGYELTIDLKGETFDTGSSLNNRGTLTINDSVGGGVITSTNGVVTNSGVFTLTGGKVQGGNNCIINYSGATFNMTGGEVRLKTGGSNHPLSNEGFANVSGGTIQKIYNRQDTEPYGELTISGTAVVEEGIKNYYYVNVTIEGGTVTGGVSSWHGLSTIKVTGGSVDSLSSSGTLILEGVEWGNITSGGKKVILKDCTLGDVTISTETTEFEITNCTAGTVTNKGIGVIDGGTYGKVTNSGTLTITGSPTITSTSGTALTNTAGVTTIENGTFNAASGSTSTVNATGGKIILPTAEAVEEGGTAIQDSTGEWAAPVNQTVKIGSTYYAYTTFEEVMAKATASGSATVKLLTNFTAVEATTIAAGKTVTLDLNGYTVTAPDVAPFITVKGALTLTNSGVLMGTQTLLKVDGGSLTLAGGNLTLGTAEAPIALTSETAVVDVTSGSFAQTGGTIVANTTGAAAIGVKTAVPLAFGAATVITVPNDGTSTAIATTTADATVTISGGEYTKVGQAVTDPIAIKNGIFDVKPEEAYVLEGYKSEQNDAGKWVIAPALGNVTITDGDGNLTTYETLDAAFAALKTIASPSACTVKLWVDADLAAKTSLSTYAPGVIDLNGCTINTPEVEEDALTFSPSGSLKIMNGTIIGATTDTFGEPIVYVNGGTDVIFENLDIINTHTKGNILEVTNKAAKFTAIGCDFATTGTVGTDSGSFVKAMQIKAPDTTFKNSTITGAKKSTGSTLFISTTTSLVMENVQVTAAGTVMSLTGGTVTLKDMRVETTGTSKDALTLNNTAATLDRVELLATGTSCDALYTNGTCNVTATNCTIAAYSYVAEVRGTSTVTLTGADTTVSGRGYYVYGSTLNLTAGTHTVTNSSWMGVYGSGTARVTGGTYSKDPTTYVPVDEGYSVKKNTNNTWTVTRAVAEVNGMEVENVMEAINASTVAGPIVVRILNNVTETLTIDADKVVDIDLNGKTLAGPLTTSGTLILTDSVGGGSLTGEPALKVLGGMTSIYGFYTTVTGALEVADSATVSITGGTYTVDPTAYLAEGYSVHNDVTAGTWTVLNADGVPDGATIALYDAEGNYLKAYLTLQAAEDETADISTCTWKLLGDIVLSESTVSIANNPAVFDLAGYTITTEQAVNFSPTTTPLLVKDGTIIGTNTLGQAVGLYGTAKTTLQNVTVEYTGANSAVQVTDAPLEAIGCTFICNAGAPSNITIGNSATVNICYTTAPETPVLLTDCVITEKRDGKDAILLTEAAVAHVTGTETVVNGSITVATTSTLEITGGTYTTADPTPYLAEGYNTSAEGGVIVVGDFVAKIGTKGYLTLEAALKAAKSGDTVLLLADTTGTLSVPSGVTIAPSPSGTMHDGSFYGSQYAILGEGSLVVYGMDSMVDSNNLTLGTKVILNTSKIAVSNVTFYGPLPEDKIVPVTAPIFTATGIMSYTENGKTACEVMALTAVSGGTQLTLASVSTPADGAVTIEMKLDENLKPEMVKDEDGNKVPVTVPVLDVEKGLELATPETPSASTTTVTELKTPDATTTVATVTTTTDAEGNVTKTTLEVKDADLVLDGVEAEIVTKTAADTPETVDADSEAMVILDAAYEVETATAETPKLSYAYDFGIVDVTYNGTHLTSVTAHLTEGVDAAPRSDTLSNAVLEVVREQGGKETVVGELSSPTFTEGDCVVPLENVSLGDGLSNIKVRLRQK